MADIVGWLRDRLGAGDGWGSVTPIEDLSVAQVCDLLANERRRWTLLVVDEHGLMDTRELSERVAEIEYGVGYTRDERKSVYVALYQSHLPLLLEYDVLEEAERQVYRPGPAFEGVREAQLEIEFRVAEGGGDG